MSDSHDCVLHHRQPRRRPPLAAAGTLILAMVMTFTLLLLVLDVPVEGALVITGGVCIAAVRACHGLFAVGRPARRRPGLAA